MAKSKVPVQTPASEMPESDSIPIETFQDETPVPDLPIIEIPVSAKSETEETTEAPAETIYEPGKLYELKIKEVSPDPNQPRKTFDEEEMNDLTASVQKHGVLQPILFRKNEEGKLLIVAGERRYQASIKAKKKTILGMFIEGKASEIALIENMQRVGLTPLEEAEGLDRLRAEQKYNNRKLAAAIGKAESTISEILSLNKLPQRIKDKIRAERVYPKRMLIEVARGKDEKEMRKLFKILEKKNISKDEIRKKRERDIEAVFKTMVNGLKTRLTGLELGKLEEEKRERIATELKELVHLIGLKLQ